MAIAVASVSTVTTKTSDSISLTKPSGLAVGDLLLSVVVNSGVSGPTNPSGFTVLTGGVDSDNKSYIEISYKVATSGDVAASNFTFTRSGNTLMGILYRITGASSTPIFATSVPYSAVADQTLILIGAGAGDNDGSTTSWASYSITGITSPTFTERIDTTTETNLSIAVADGVISSKGTITAYDVVGGVNMDGIRKFVVFIPQQQDVTADVSRATITPTMYEATIASVSIGVDVSRTEITPTINGIATTSSSDATRWQNETKPTTTWTNETI